MPTPVLSPNARARERLLVERYARMANEGLEHRWSDPLLRMLDAAGAALALLALLPLLALAALAVRLTSPGPILYRGLRVGRGGGLFTMVKFRTLKDEAESRLGPYLGLELTQLTAAEHTPVGRWLRATHLDELPQLWNVLRGDMSLVGPRPIRPLFFEMLCSGTSAYWQRMVVAPGVTGLAQLRLTREASWEDKLAHDLEYVADRSLRLYLTVVGATLWRVVGRLAGAQPSAELASADDR